MPTFTFSCGKHRFERQFPITAPPPGTVPCLECETDAERVWEPAQFICDRADADVDVVPPQFQVSDRARPETAAEGKRLERAYQKKIHRRRRELSEKGGGAIAQTHSIPAHLYHGKIRQTGDKNYWLDAKNRNKHTSTRVDKYGRSRRGKG